MSHAVVKIHIAENRLGPLVMKGRQKSRNQAIREAQANLKEIEPQTDRGIEEAISEAEQILAECGGKLTVESIESILDRIDRVVSLAGAYERVLLCRAAQWMGELGAAMVSRPDEALAPVAVHLRAVRMFSTHKSGPPPEGAGDILEGLAKVRRRFLPDQPLKVPDARG